MPCVGHMGIADSEGIIHDFAGPYYVSLDDFAFGRVARFLTLEPRSLEEWDASIESADATYRKRMHNLCCDNCHSHVATALNTSRYAGRQWDMVALAMWMTVAGRYTSCGAAVYVWAPFLCILAIILASALA